MVELERSVIVALEEKLLLGTTVAKDKTEQLREKVEALHEQGIKPKLVMMRVGDKADDLAYQRSALSRMEKVNILSEVQEFPNDVTEEVFLRQLEENNQNDEVHGILIFLPLPKHLDLKKVKECISPDKDIDAISPVNIARLMNAEECFVPCTPKAVARQTCCCYRKIHGCRKTGEHVVVERKCNRYHDAFQNNKLTRIDKECGYYRMCTWEIKIFDRRVCFFAQYRN